MDLTPYAACLAALVISAAGPAHAQPYPSKPIRLVASEPGGNVDFVARQIAPRLSTSFGQQIIVENRPSGIIPVEIVAKAVPDGYTLLIESSTFWVGPLLQKTPYDPAADFILITLPTAAPFFLYVHPSVPAATLRELIALAKARPGVLNYGSAGSGASNHLATELFKSMAGVDIVRVPYKGAGPAGIGLVANQVQLMFGSAPFGMTQVKSGRLRVLAVASAKPSALAPEIPTMVAAGLPGYEATFMSGLWAPARTPGALIQRLNAEVVRALNGTDVKDKLLNAGVEPLGTTPEQSIAIMTADIAKWAKVIKDAGIRND